MSETKRAAISLGADVGGNDAHRETSIYVMALRKCLEETCIGPYGTTFKEFALVMRIDGVVQSWDKQGVENIKVEQKSDSVSADIFVPARIWNTGDAKKIRNFFATEVKSAICKIIEQSEKIKVDIQPEKLLEDVEKALEKFLGQDFSKN